MGLFGSIFKGVTGPLRGIGRVLKGDIKGAIGAFGDTASLAAPVLGATGVGAPLAIAAGAAGGAMQKFDDPDFNVGSVLRGAAGGAGRGAALHGAGKLASSGISSVLAKGGSAVAPVSSLPGSVAGAVPTSTAGSASTLSGVSAGLSRGGPGLTVTAPQAAGVVSKAAGTVTENVGGGNFLSGIGAFINKNPKVAAQILGTAADVYGAHQQGRIAGQYLDLDKKEQERKQLEMLFQLVGPVGRF